LTDFELCIHVFKLIFMKKLILAAVFMGLRILAISQLVDTTTYVYCKALCESKVGLSFNKLDEVEISMDFGNGEKFTPKHPMRDEAGKETDIESVVDLMNFMSDRKWLLDKIYLFTASSGALKVVTHIVFKKPKYKFF
jgi:hypothetical protein